METTENFLLGILITMGFCGVILYLSTSLKSYLFYSMFLINVLMLHKIIQYPLIDYFVGEAKFYLFIFLKIIVPTFLAINIAFFTKSFFNLKKDYPISNILSNFIIFISISMICIQIIFLEDRILPRISLLFLPIFLFIGLNTIKEKNITAVFYSIAIVIFMIPPVARPVLQLLNYETHPYIYDNILLTTTICSIILSFATLTNLKDIITEKRKFEKQVHSKSRFVAMGEMIANIAHQWRQPLNNLSLININIYMHNTKGTLTPEILEKKHNESNIQIKHMSDTIDDFMNFFSQKKQKETFQLNTIVDKVLEFMNISIIKNKIDIKIVSTEDTKITTFKNELFQVLMIILTNAKDVLKNKPEEDRKITIEIKNSKLSIMDNDGGIDEKIIHKIFEPYFTTKESKNGTGLGLYTAKIIVEENIGGLLFVNNINNGAKFTIDLNNIN